MQRAFFVKNTFLDEVKDEDGSRVNDRRRGKSAPPEGRFSDSDSGCHQQVRFGALDLPTSSFDGSGAGTGGTRNEDVEEWSQWAFCPADCVALPQSLAGARSAAFADVVIVVLPPPAAPPPGSAQPRPARFLVPAENIAAAKDMGLVPISGPLHIVPVPAETMATATAAAPAAADGAAAAPSASVPTMLPRTSTPKGLEYFFNAATKIYEVHWTVDAKMLKSTNTELTSPVFLLSLDGKDAEFKMVIVPSAVSKGRRGHCFLKAQGRGSIQLKCL